MSSKYQISTFCKTFKDPTKCVNEETPHYCPLNDQCYSEPMVNITNKHKNYAGKVKTTTRNKHREHSPNTRIASSSTSSTSSYNPQVWSMNQMYYNPTTTRTSESSSKMTRNRVFPLDLWYSQSIG